MVACHKPTQLPENEMLLPIHVGAATSSLNLGIQRDDEGENISDKNYCYCELTALYWAWKNLKDVDVIGLCHYRRYFDFHKQCTRFLPASSFPISAMDGMDFSIDQKTIDKVLDGEVVVCKAVHINSTLKLHYCECHFSEDFVALQTVVNEQNEPKYKKAFEKVFVKGNALHPYNMILMRRDDFDAYCSWLFGVLSAVEQRIDINNYSDYQKRIFGFMSERLLNVWLEAEGKLLVEKPLIFIEERSELSMPQKYAPRKTWKYYIERTKCNVINRLYRNAVSSI